METLKELERRIQIQEDIRAIERLQPSIGTVWTPRIGKACAAALRMILYL